MAKVYVTPANTGGGGGGSGTVTSVGVTSTTLTITNSPVTTSGNITANIPDGYLKVGTGITGTLQNVVDTNGTATTLFLSSTEAQLTSPLRITTSDASGFYLDAEDSATNNRFSIKRDPSSQEVTLDFASNPSGSTTLVGAIRTYGDGVNLSNAMSFREDGNVGIGTDTPGAKLDIHSAGATVAQFNKTGSGNSYIQQLTAGAAKWKHGFTSASGAFDIIDDVNSLTRLSLLNTGQLKLNAYTSTSAFTGTTAGFLAFDSTGNILSVAAPGGGSPAGTTGAIQFNNAGAFGADSTNFFWDDTNKRLGIGTNAPTNTFEIASTSASPFKVATTASYFRAIFQNSGASGIFDFNSSSFQFPTNNVEFGTSSSLGARVGIKGSGSTSATTSLLVQNSAGTAALTITDDLIVTVPTLTTTSGNVTISGGTVQAGVLRAQYFNTPNNSFSVFECSNSNGNAFFYQNVSIGTGVNPVASAALEVASTTRGFLPPQMTTAQKLAIGTPAAGLQVYDSTLNQMSYYNGTTWINF